MIRKLKMKFIVINMILLTALLIGIFAAVYIFTERNAMNESIKVMENMIENNGKYETPNDDNSGNNEQQNKDSSHEFLNRSAAFLVIVDKDEKIKEVIGQYFIITDADKFQEIVSFTLESDDETGIITDQNLRYLKKNAGTDMKIAFADRTEEINTLQYLVTTSLLVGSSSLLILFFISLFLASWAVKPVERSWEQQRRFVADASHELKTPLTVILANTDIILSHKDESVEKQMKWLNYIKTEGQRMAGLVSDLLFLAKSDDTTEAAVFSNIDLSDIVWTCLLAFESVIYEKGKTLQSDIESDLYIYGNKESLKQLIGILLDNAVKYSDEAGTISVTLKQAHDMITLSVHNTGKPIDENHVPRLFERFYRVDEARAKKDGGYGLGLAIAKRITESHKGKITVSSSKDEGTTFTVLLSAKKIT